ncbi:MAG: type 4a pilus biogenesis protein PilO [Deltaproteobacteria bacterium]|nr:type 4a pilus biogenesis protein PilO [Deltaproteobacteria bacterium]MBT8359951.1 type 4a pilus biogenesis protein PilO [Deltaproteobacteria bacterium]
MKKANSKFATFIDEKYIPLSKNIKIVICLALIILPIALFYFLFFQPNSLKVTGLEKQKAQLVKDIQDLKEKERNKPILLKQVAEIEDEFEEAALLLPKSKEIPRLLTDISALGRNAGLDFLTFIPRAEVPKDFYDEIPVDINIRGPYHSVGFFFDQVSKLDRIVSVSNVRMASPEKVQGEMLLNSNCQLVTYRFTNKPLPTDDKK